MRSVTQTPVVPLPLFPVRENSPPDGLPTWTSVVAHCGQFQFRVVWPYVPFAAIGFGLAEIVAPPTDVEGGGELEEEELELPC